MNIVKIANPMKDKRTGHYRIRYTIPMELRPTIPSNLWTRTGEPPARVSKDFRSYLEADEFRRQEARLFAAGLWTHPKARGDEGKRQSLTVGQWLQKWHDGRLAAGDIIESTHEKGQEALNHRILTVSGPPSKLRDLPLVTLNKVQVAQWWQETREKFPDTAARNRQVLGTLGQALRAAEDQGHIDHAPAMPKAPKPTAKWDKRLPSDEELQTVLDNITDRYRVAAMFTLHCGLRINESLGIRRQDIELGADADGNETVLAVQVRGQIKHRTENGKRVRYWSEHTKTNKSRRTVPVLPQDAPVIYERYTRAGNRPDALLTTTPDGKPVNNMKVNEAIKETAKRHGNTERIHNHQGRYWLASRLLGLGFTPRDVAEITGHDSIDVLMNAYLQPKKDAPQLMMDALARDLK